MDSALAKYARALKHLAELRAVVDERHAADLGGDEMTLAVNYPYGDGDPRAVVTIRLELQAPSEWSLMMGDILTNLRAALDHAVYGHATGLKPLTSKQRENLYHPFVQVRAEWEGTPETTAEDGTITEGKSGVRDKLQDLVTPNVLQVIEDNQPFNSSDGNPSRHGMAILNGLVNRDKHRAVLQIPINVAALVLGDTNLEIINEGELRYLPGGVVEKDVTVRRGLAAAGAPLGHTLGSLALNTEFLEQIEIPNTGGERRPFITTMETLVDATATYLNALEAAGC